jgi:NADPH:quinone reductase-like Zn-dependent oxidoreductase
MPACAISRRYSPLTSVTVLPAGEMLSACAARMKGILMTTMKAVRAHAYGGPEVLRYEDVPKPEPGKGELLIKIHAAGINPSDWKVRAGYFKDFVPFPMPFVPGTALSGTVAALGQEVFGSSVFGRSGSYAEYTTTKPTLITAKPRSLDHIHAAAVPVSALAAWHALFGERMIDPKPGQTILIHGAAGGVGSFAAQLAKWKGARVIGTSSASNESYLRELGVDQVVDYRKQPFDEVVQNVDAVLDTIGGDVEKRSWNVLKPGGVLASLVAQKLTPPQNATPGLRGVAVSANLANPHLAEIATLLDAGTVKVNVSDVLPLAEARRAQEMSESGHVRGKVVLNVAG